MTNERKKLVYDFINGNYIENESELENDYKFMMDVINYSKDRNIYYLCSKEVKCNLEFVKFLIHKFKNRRLFICHVVDNYIKNNFEDEVGVFELLIEFTDILNSIGVDYNALSYNIKKHNIYKNTIDEINKLINAGRLNNLVSGLGFSYIISKYGKSEIVMNYFAYNYVSEIFYSSKNLRLEDLIHKMFSTSDELLKYGVIDFILDYVKGYDEVLANYLLLNLENVKKVELSINYIISNWDNYGTENDSLDIDKNKFLCDVVDLNTNRILGINGPKLVKKN